MLVLANKETFEVAGKWQTVNCLAYDWIKTVPYILVTLYGVIFAKR